MSDFARGGPHKGWWPYLRESYGKRLRAWRRQAGISETALARAAQVSPETIRRIEAGTSKSAPAGSVLLRIYQATGRGVTLHYQDPNKFPLWKHGRK